jgi:hypothetical protein
MTIRSRLGRAAAALLAVATLAPAAHAQLFWMPPDFSGAPVNGDEPGIAQPLPGATAAELEANLVWSIRAGLNVAALQCQFSPALRTVKLYNDIIAHHDKELDKAQATLMGYFKRQAGKSATAVKQAQNNFDQFTTRTYNSFSTLHAQLGFCQTAAKIGRIVIGLPKGQLHDAARQYMREFRNSLIPAGDRIFQIHAMEPIRNAAVDALPPNCFAADGSVRIKKRKCQI